MKNKNHLARVEWRYAVQLGNDDADGQIYTYKMLSAQLSGHRQHHWHWPFKHYNLLTVVPLTYKTMPNCAISIQCSEDWCCGVRKYIYIYYGLLSIH